MSKLAPMRPALQLEAAMPFMPWNPRFQTGINLVDVQHRALVDTLNGLHAAMTKGKGQDEVAGILNFLAVYTKTHFKDKEDLLSLHGYPAIARHEARHASLLTQVMDLLGELARGKGVVTLDLLDFLQSWLSEHILIEDQAYVRYLPGERDHSVAQGPWPGAAGGAAAGGRGGGAVGARWGCALARHLLDRPPLVPDPGQRQQSQHITHTSRSDRGSLDIVSEARPGATEVEEKKRCPSQSRPWSPKSSPLQFPPR